MGIKGSMQIVYNSDTHEGYFDVDRFNPYQDVRGFMGHAFLEVLFKDHGFRPDGLHGPDQAQAQERYNKLR